LSCGNIAEKLIGEKGLSGIAVSKPLGSGSVENFALVLQRCRNLARLANTKSDWEHSDQQTLKWTNIKKTRIPNENQQVDSLAVAASQF